MSTVVEDTIDGSTISVDKDEGYQATRAFIVYDVAGSASARLYNAMEDAGVPSLYAAHPAVASICCYSKSASPVNSDSTQFRVVCNYKAFTFGYSGGATQEKCQIAIGSSVQSVQTTKDKDDNEILLGNSPSVTITEVDPDGNSITRTLKPQTGLVDVQVPQTTMRFSRKETQDTLVKSQAYVGKLNDDTFFGGAAGTVLCTRIESSSTDGGVNFDVAYEFQYRPDGWKADVVYIDPETSLPLKGANATDGTKKSVDIYEEADFDALEIYIA